jgi:hypothetical protein
MSAKPTATRLASYYGFMVSWADSLLPQRTASLLLSTWQVQPLHNIWGCHVCTKQGGIHVELFACTTHVTIQTEVQIIPRTMKKCLPSSSNGVLLDIPFARRGGRSHQSRYRVTTGGSMHVCTLERSEGKRKARV